MNCGVPTAAPCIVSAVPLADEGRKTGSSVRWLDSPTPNGEL